MDSNEQKIINAKYVCMRCGEIVANGVGPSGLPMITTILNKLHSSHIFYIDACEHDEGYHLQEGKDLVDRKFLESMKESVREEYTFVTGTGFWGKIRATARNSAIQSKRSFFLGMAYRNYWFVRGKASRQAYKDGACETLSI